VFTHRLLLKQGIADGLDLAADVLENDDSDYHKMKVIKNLEEYAGISGTPEEMLQWIEENRDTFADPE
jgi:hypothetical protein